MAKGWSQFGGAQRFLVMFHGPEARGTEAMDMFDVD